MQKNTDIKAKKALGQNFLQNPAVCDKIFKSANLHQDNLVLEIGPGLGALTKFVLGGSSYAILAEKDPECYAHLKTQIALLYPSAALVCFKQRQQKFEADGEFKTNNQSKKIILLNCDALQLDIKDALLEFNKVFNTNFAELCIIGNLPYNIGTLLVYKWCEGDIDFVKSITIMLQKEVVMRIVASNTSQHYGKLSVIVQSAFSARHLFDVSKGNFRPEPSVMSSVVRLERLDGYFKINRQELSKFCEVIFRQRRKTLANLVKNTAYQQFFNLEANKPLLSKRSDELDTQKLLKLFTDYCLATKND